MGAALVAEAGNEMTRARRARLALSKRVAAEALRSSVDVLGEHVLPELRVVRRGRRVFTAITELERWLDMNASRPLTRMP